MVKSIICNRDEFALLKRLDNGQYLNLTDLDFESAKNGNSVYYDIDEDSKYVLMLTPIFDADGQLATFYVPVDLDSLIQYAPSVKKLKRISIPDLVIAKLMQENTSIRYRLTYNTVDVMENKIELFLNVGHKGNTEYAEECKTFFENVYAEEL